MTTIYELIKRAKDLAQRKEEGSITPEEVGKLHEDTLDYIAGLERTAKGLGIAKVYRSKGDMENDTSPTASNGVALRFGQLVCIHDDAHPASPDNGSIYAFQNPGWLLIGNIGNIHSLKSLIEKETEKRRAEDDRLQEKMDEEVRTRETVTTGLQGRIDTLQSTLNALMGGNSSEAIESFNEVISFLAGVRDNDTLTALLDGLNSRLSQVSSSVSDERAAREQVARELRAFMEEGSKNIGGLLNITRQVPLPDGNFYTLDACMQALRALNIAEGQRKGLIVTFEASEGKWEDYRYVGSDTGDDAFASIAMWQRHAPEVDVRKIQELIDNSTQHVEVAHSVDESDRPVASRAVKSELDRLKTLTLDSDVEPTDEGSKVTLSQEGRTVAEFTVAGGGGSSAQSTRAVVLATLSHKRVKLGDKVSLTYGFTHYVDGEEDGTGARLSLEVRKGASVIATEPLGEVASGSVSTMDLTKYITTADAYSVSIVARYEYNGELKTRKATSQLSVVDLSIALYNEREVESYIAAGGYKSADPANIIVSVKGGAREISMYIDGNEDTREVRTLTGSGGRQTFTLSPRQLSPGSHSVQFVAGIDGLKSNSLYMDILVSGGDTPFVGLLYSRPDGMVMGAGETPALLAYQYEGLTWKYIAVGSQPGGAASLTVESPKGRNSFVTPRTYQAYNTRMMKQGMQQWAYSLQDIRKAFRIEVAPTTLPGIGIKEGAAVELDAEGRSNAEANPAVWTSGKAKTRFIGVDFSSSGWSQSRENGADVPVLRLINGAKAEIDYKPFATDAKIKGLTLTFEVRMSNVRRADEAVLSCLDNKAGGGFAGFLISAGKVRMPTGGHLEFVDEEGNTIRRDLGLEMPYAHGEFYSLTLVVHPENEEKTLRLYINGVLSKAETYQDTIFAQRVAKGITIDSTWADVELRHVRIYETALTDDEVLDNYVTDRFTLASMDELRKRNDVLSDATGEVSHDKLRSKGKATLTITMPGGVETLWGKSTDTKSNYAFDELIFRSPFGKAYDLRVTDGAMRRQGTSTSTYPVKNLRIYLNRKGFNTKVYRNVGTGNEDVWEEVPEKTYVMREGAKPMKIINLKTDYADSSMCYNTGTAILLNDYLVKNNPNLKNKGMQMDDKARMAIDGLPIDVFTNDTEDGDKRYCGQFQFNNDKSGSGYLFGQTKNDGSEIALEFINNTNPAGNFHIMGNNVRAQLDSRGADGFDASVEFLFPEKDYLWNGDTPETTAPENIKQAVVRLWQFIHDCTPQGTDPSTMTEREVKQAFVSEKFKREVSQYFDVTNLTMWWVLTDYHLSVDQRVKNTFFRTWGDGVWWLTYYDGDTAFGKRNDAFLAYDYNVNRDTRDLQRNKFAFEGHDSRLWCLVLANLDAELKASAKTLRATLTNEVYKHVFNTMMMGNWSERQYNKSGIYKYVKPTYTDYNGGGFMNYIFALNGNMYAYRNQLMERRFSLLDAKYNVGQYESDVIAGYIGKDSVTTQILATAGDEYYFGWKTQNGRLTDHQAVNRDDVATFNFTSAISQNDPIRLIGASRMRKIDLSTTAPYMQGAWNLNGCKMLEELVATTSEANPTAWYPMLKGITGLRHVDLTGQKGVTGTEDEQARTFDVSRHSGLKELKLGGTGVRGVKVAGGSPLTLLELPSTLTTLRLKDLPKLTMEGLKAADWGSVTSLDMGGCVLLDWKTILERCVNVERVRIEGVDFTDSGALLRKLSRVKGLDINGNGVDTCELVGRCQLSAYVDDATLAAWQAHFPSLDIRQPAYTVLEFDDSVADDANVSNLDNSTGYKFGNKYEPSGHVAKILSMRHRVMAKVTADKEALIYPLHDSNSNYYADADKVEECSPAILTGEEGDWMLYEPHYWYKGVNDTINSKKYAVYAFGKEMPPVPDASLYDKRTFESLEKIKGYKVELADDKATIKTASVADAGFEVAVVDCKGWKRVRFTSVSTIGNIGNVFADAAGNIISRPKTSGLRDQFSTGMYLVCDVPDGAEKLYISVPANGKIFFDYVLLTNSDNILDVEPDWVEHKACLVGAVKASLPGNFYRSVKGVCQSNISYTNTVGAIDKTSGMRVTTYEQYKDVANLFMSKYGRRDSQACVGMAETSVTVGLTDFLGMTDTVPAIGEGFGAYVKTDPINGATLVRINATNTLGYDNWCDGHGEIMDAYIPKSNETWHIKSTTTEVRNIVVEPADRFIAGVTHGRRMDITCAGTMSGSDRSYYSDYNRLSSNRLQESRVMFGFHSNARRASGPFAMSLRSLAEVSPYDVIRMMFEGNIRTASTIDEFKQATDIRR